MAQAKLETKPSLALNRHYPVAPEKVWRAWTDPQAIAKWWGPGGNDPVSVVEVDVRVGGRFRMVFGGAQGRDHECAGIYREVVPNRKLVFTWYWPNSTPERVSQVTILFKPAGGGTDLEFLHEQFFDKAARDGHQRGWSESLVKLERFLGGQQPTLTVTRDYPFAPGKVWRAWTDPQALGQWFRPDASFSIPVAETDVRVGGRFRVLMVDAKGGEFDLSGVYREVDPGRRLVMTWGWKNQPGHESLVTVNFRPSNQGTQLELRHEGYLDFENQPTHEQGWNGALDKLERLLGTDRIEREIVLKAPRSRVWRALSVAEEFGNWFGVALRGKTFAAGQRVKGQVTHPGYEHLVWEVVIECMEPERMLSFRWRPYADNADGDFLNEPTTLVVFELREVEGGTLLSVVESGFDGLPSSRREEAFRMNSGGWDEQVKNIEKHVATP